MVLHFIPNSNKNQESQPIREIWENYFTFFQSGKCQGIWEKCLNQEKVTELIGPKSKVLCQCFILQIFHCNNIADMWNWKWVEIVVMKFWDFIREFCFLEMLGTVKIVARLIMLLIQFWRLFYSVVVHVCPNHICGTVKAT